MSADYISLKANELVQGQIILDQGGESKITSIRKSPGRIYVVIRRDMQKAQLQFSPMEDIPVRIQSASEQSFPDTLSDAPQPANQAEDTQAAELPPADPEPDYANLLAELISSELAPEPGPFIEELQPKRTSALAYFPDELAPAWQEEPLQTKPHLPDALMRALEPPRAYRFPTDGPFSEEGTAYSEDIRIAVERPDHNKKVILVMRLGAVAMLIGILLIAFGVADRVNGTIGSVGILILAIGGVTYFVGAVVGFFTPDKSRFDLSELTEALDHDWDLLFSIMCGIALTSPARVAPPVTTPVNVVPTTPTTAILETQAMARQTEQKAVSGTPPPSDMLSSNQSNQLLSSATHHEATRAAPLSSKPSEQHNDGREKIEAILGQLDEMGAIESQRQKEEKASEEDADEEQPTRPF